MKSQELRIGNQIWRPCCYDEVVEIRENGIIGLDSLRGLIPYSEIEPIPITDELLLKIGFRKNSFGWWRLDKRNDKFMIKGYSQITTIEYWNEVHNPEDVTEANYGSTIELPYKIHLHTFQNIWHLLTGEELEIEL